MPRPPAPEASGFAGNACGPPYLRASSAAHHLAGSAEEKRLPARGRKSVPRAAPPGPSPASRAASTWGGFGWARPRSPPPPAAPTGPRARRPRRLSASPALVRDGENDPRVVVRVKTSRAGGTQLSAESVRGLRPSPSTNCARGPARPRLPGDKPRPGGGAGPRPQRPQCGPRTVAGAPSSRPREPLAHRRAAEGPRKPAARPVRRPRAAPNFLPRGLGLWVWTRGPRRPNPGDPLLTDVSILVVVLLLLHVQQNVPGHLLHGSPGGGFELGAKLGLPGSGTARLSRACRAGGGRGVGLVPGLGAAGPGPRSGKPRRGSRRPTPGARGYHSPLSMPSAREAGSGARTSPARGPLGRKSGAGTGLGARLLHASDLAGGRGVSRGGWEWTGLPRCCPQPRQLSVLYQCRHVGEACFL